MIVAIPQGDQTVFCEFEDGVCQSRYVLENGRCSCPAFSTVGKCVHKPVEVQCSFPSMKPVRGYWDYEVGERLVVDPEEHENFHGVWVPRRLVSVLKCVQGCHNVLITGPAGTGKTSLATVIRDEFTVVNCGSMQEPRTALIGYMSLRAGSTEFVLSEFAQAIGRPGAVVLDELSRADRDALNIILPVLDHQRELRVDELGIRVKRHPECVIVATANSGSAYAGVSRAWEDRALRDRFECKIELDFLPFEIEREMVGERLARFAYVQRREFKKGNFSHGISVRMLKACSILGVEAAILNDFPDDGTWESQRFKVKQIWERTNEQRASPEDRC